jgi:hypothetical protein
MKILQNISNPTKEINDLPRKFDCCGGKHFMDPYCPKSEG